MDNEVFQKAVIQELKSISARQDEFGKRLDQFGTRQDEFAKQLNLFGVRQDEFAKQLNQFGVRQDEMYLVVRSIEHSNNAGKAQLDSHNFRLSKIEGKFKKVAKVCGEEAEVLNL